jgi:flagellar biosynthesis protein FlhF
MELQRVLAHNTRQALDQVHKLYGENALVVSNKRTRDRTEVIVAIDLEKDAQTALDEVQVPARDSHQLHDSGEMDFQSVMESEVFASPVDDTETNVCPQQPAYSELVVPPVEQAQQSVMDQRDHLKAREIVDLVKQELAVMQREFKLAQQLDIWAGTHAVSEEMRPLIEALNETGIPIALRTLITESIDKNADMPQALRDMTTVLASGIKQIDLLQELAGLHIVAGGSGCGKTLMAGRLAKQGALVHGEQAVAIISYNDSSFGAWNRTQLVGAQAGVDTFRATSSEILSQLLQELDARKLIIIDTPGESTLEHTENLASLLPEAQKHLVMAADASEASAKRYIKPHNFEWDSIMLSRLEHYVYPWAVINVLLDSDIPVSVAAAEPSIVDPAISITGHTLAQHAVSHLPISFV